jgi:uncharacterized protein (DUF1810 family)
MDPTRFLAAQDAVWPQVLSALRAGAKRSHWMWFVFPQLAGLGHSATARHFALADLATARAYRDHPILGGRLDEAMTALLTAPGDDPTTILGPIDALKLNSSMTLFAAAGVSGAAVVLDRFFAGARDPVTLSAIAR